MDSTQKKRYFSRGKVVFSMDQNEYKIGTQMRLALGTDYETRKKAFDLNVGYDAYGSKWELLIRYNGNLDVIAEEVGFTYIELLNNYAIIRIHESKIDYLTGYVQILFIDKPKQMYKEQMNTKIACIQSCMNIEINDEFGIPGSLSGKGVLVAILDSGLDFANSNFIEEDGQSKVLYYWDQNVDGKAPFSYGFGTEYTANEINAPDFVKNNDESGHGTAVASIVAQCANEVSFVIVKLRQDENITECKTTSLICAIDYVIRIAEQLNMPLAINISYGNNYGDHTGNSFLESYIDSVSTKSKLSIVVGTGNDGNTNRHTRIDVEEYESYKTNFVVEQYETSIDLQIWHSFLDDISFMIVTPDGILLGPFTSYQPIAEYELLDMKILVIAGFPSQINEKQELYISLVPKNTYITAGQYTILINTRTVIDGIIDMWLPLANSTNSNSTFLTPSPDVTLTIPSSAKNVISVGAYDLRTERYANFSGRGFDADGNVKPDVCAPGVNVAVNLNDETKNYVTGTSFATPFVTAAAALLMQWGIVLNNDPFLFGQKLKIYLIKGARPLIGDAVIPNSKTGYGAICVEDSLKL